MADKPKRYHFFGDKNTGLGTNSQNPLAGIISQLPDQVEIIQNCLFQSEENLLGRRLPLAQLQINACLDKRDPVELLKNVVEVFESVLTNAIDEWVKPSLTRRAMPLDDLIKKINNDPTPNFLRDVALALKSIYAAYPDSQPKISTQNDKVLAFISKIEEPYSSPQKKLS